MVIDLLFFFILPLVLIFIILFPFNMVKNPYISIIFLSLASYAGYLGKINLSTRLHITLFHIFFVISLIFVTYNKIIHHNFKIKIIGLEVELLILFCLITFSLIYSPNRIDGLFYFIRFFTLIIMIYVIVNSIENINNIEYLMIAVILITTVLALYSVIDGFKPENMVYNFTRMGEKLEGRASINTHDPNIFASHFFMPIIFTCTILIVDGVKKKYKIIAVPILLILFAGLAATFSRSAWISTFFALVLLSIIRKKIKLYYFISLGLVFAVLFFPNIRIILENLVDRVYDIFAGYEDESSRLRLIMALAGIYMGFDSFLLGVGFRGYPIYFNRYFTTTESFGMTEPHNIFYTIFAELGLVGLVIYLVILYKIGKLAYCNYKSNKNGIEGSIHLSLFLTFLSYILFYQFYGGGMVDNNFWIVVGLIISLRYMKTKEPVNDRI